MFLWATQTERGSRYYYQAFKIMDGTGLMQAAFGKNLAATTGAKLVMGNRLQRKKQLLGIKVPDTLRPDIGYGGINTQDFPE